MKEYYQQILLLQNQLDLNLSILTLSEHLTNLQKDPNEQSSITAGKILQLKDHFTTIIQLL